MIANKKIIVYKKTEIKNEVLIVGLTIDYEHELKLMLDV
jgi:hypothetical protein